MHTYVHSCLLATVCDAACMPAVCTAMLLACLLYWDAAGKMREGLACRLHAGMQTLPQGKGIVCAVLENWKINLCASRVFYDRAWANLNPVKFPQCDRPSGPDSGEIYHFPVKNSP